MNIVSNEDGEATGITASRPTTVNRSTRRAISARPRKPPLPVTMTKGRSGGMCVSEQLMHPVGPCRSHAALIDAGPSNHFATFRDSAMYDYLLVKLPAWEDLNRTRHWMLANVRSNRGRRSRRRSPSLPTSQPLTTGYRAGTHNMVRSRVKGIECTILRVDIRSKPNSDASTVSGIACPVPYWRPSGTEHSRRTVHGVSRIKFALINAPQ